MIKDENLKLFFGIYDFKFIKNIQLLNGGKNNKVLKIEFNNNYIIVLKHYFSHKTDIRNRLKTEWDFLKHAQKLNYKCVPQPLQMNENLNMASYSYIKQGKNISKKIQNEDIISSAKFIVDINKVSFDKNFPLASESCNSLRSHNFNINKRVFGLSEKIEDKSLFTRDIIDFINQKIIPLWNEVKKFNIKNTRNMNKKVKLFLSPSDFGFHNMIKNDQSKLIFLDFEYSGIDDLVKLSNDFFFSSQNVFPKKQREIFLDYIERELDVDDFFRKRTYVFEFAYRLKWLCIKLNQFTKNGILRNKFIGIKTTKGLEIKEFDTIKSIFNKLENDFLIHTS